MSQPLRRTERPLVKRVPYQYSPPTSKYAPKPGFQHRSTFRTKQELRDEIVTLKDRVSDLESRLSEALKKNNALKKKLDHTLDSRKRKGEDIESQHQKKKKHNVDLQILERTAVDKVARKVTMPDNQDGPSNEDSIWIPLMNDDDEDAPSQGIAVPEPTTATQQTIAERQLAELTAPRKRCKGLKDKVSSKKTNNVDLHILERTAVDKVARKTTVSILKRKGQDLQVPQQKTKKLDFDLQSLKRKAVDNLEDGPPQKYRIYKTKNDLKKTASNVSLQTRLDDIVSKVTMPDNQDGPSNEDSIWIPLMDDDDEDAPSQGIAVPEPTTATQQTIAERQLAELTATRKRSKGLKDNDPILNLASKFKNNPIEVLNAIGTLIAESPTK